MNRKETGIYVSINAKNVEQYAVIDIQDLLEVFYTPAIENIDSNMCSLTLRTNIEGEEFTSTCNINNQQIHRFINNLDMISSRLKIYLANQR